MKWRHFGALRIEEKQAMKLTKISFMLSIIDNLQANHHTYLKHINMPWTWQFRWIQPEKVLEGGAVF